jgi:hypothetical protein
MANSAHLIASPPWPRSSWRRALGAGAALATVAACAFALRSVDVHALRAAFSGAAAWPVALAMLINLGPRSLARARRTLVLLRGAPSGAIGFGALLRLLAGGYAIGYLVPGPSEEAMVTAALTRFGFRVSDLLSMHALDKILGILSVALVALPLLPIAPLPGAARLPLAAGAAIALAGVGVLAARAGRAIPVRRLGEALGCLLVSNLSSLAMLCLCLRAVQASPGVSSCVAIFFSLACASALPLGAPIGLFESTFVLAATRVGVPPGTALAAGALYHAALVAPLVLAGLPALARLPSAKGAEDQPTWSECACAPRV